MPGRTRALLARAMPVLAASALPGCARTVEPFARDGAACQRQATVSPAAATSVEQSAYRECVTAHGYARQELLIPGTNGHRGIARQPQAAP